MAPAATVQTNGMERPGPDGDAGGGCGALGPSEARPQQQLRAKARWSILRNAILKSRKQQQEGSVSIHRFPGYQLLVRHQGNSSNFSTSNDGACMEERMLGHYFAHLRLPDLSRGNDSDFEQEVINQVESIVGAILCCTSSIQIHNKAVKDVVEKAETTYKVTIDLGGTSNFDKQTFMNSLNERCKTMHATLTWQAQLEHDGDVTLNIRPTAMGRKLSLASDCTTYGCFHYPLPSSTANNNKLDHDKKGNHHPMSTSCLWTREPIVSMARPLSLDELVSHRVTGVDNTGNICVWDSERTLSFLLHHPETSPSMFPPLHSGQTTGYEHIRSILELGTGMAGLAALSLAMRLATIMQGREHRTKSERIRVTLTDGHINGVKNNRVNHQLNNAYYKCESMIHNGNSYSSNNNIYAEFLNVEAKVLQWTCDLNCDSSNNLEADTGGATSEYDVCLISDCTHFQNFHAALATTVLRHLKVGGTAIFCQPHRDDSLTNFLQLLTATGDAGSDGGKEQLVATQWWTHTILEKAHENALAVNKSTKEGERISGTGSANTTMLCYDPNIHQPQILIVTKLRQMTRSDRDRFVNHQSKREQRKNEKQIHDQGK